MRTSLYSVLCIVVRLGAVLLFVNSLLWVPQWLGTWQSLASGEAVLSDLVMIAVSLLLSFLLWLYPGLIARPAAGNSARATFESPIEARDLHYIALCVLGVWFCIDGLTGCVVETIRLCKMAEVGGAHFSSTLGKDPMTLVGNLVQILLGIALTFGARGLTGLLHRLREHDLASPVRSDGEAGPRSP